MNVMILMVVAIRTVSTLMVAIIVNVMMDTILTQMAKPAIVSNQFVYCILLIVIV